MISPSESPPTPVPGSAAVTQAHYPFESSFESSPSLPSPASAPAPASTQRLPRWISDDSQPTVWGHGAIVIGSLFVLISLYVGTNFYISRQFLQEWVNENSSEAIATAQLNQQQQQIQQQLAVYEDATQTATIATATQAIQTQAQALSTTFDALVVTLRPELNQLRQVQSGNVASLSNFGQGNSPPDLLPRYTALEQSINGVRNAKTALDTLLNEPDRLRMQSRELARLGQQLEMVDQRLGRHVKIAAFFYSHHKASIILTIFLVPLTGITGFFIGRDGVNQVNRGIVTCFAIVSTGTALSTNLPNVFKYEENFRSHRDLYLAHLALRSTIQSFIATGGTIEGDADNQRFVRVDKNRFILSVDKRLEELSKLNIGFDTQQLNELNRTGAQLDLITRPNPVKN